MVSIGITLQLLFGGVGSFLDTRSLRYASRRLFFPIHAWKQTGSFRPRSGTGKLATTWTTSSINTKLGFRSAAGGDG